MKTTLSKKKKKKRAVTSRNRSNFRSNVTWQSSFLFSPINMHGKYGFGPLNHIAGRVKIVLGKKKADKHTVWAPGEVAQHPTCQSQSLSAVYVRRYMEYVRGAEEYFAGDIPKEKRVFSYRNAET